AKGRTYRSQHCVTPVQQQAVLRGAKKGDPPGGTAGRVGYDTGWMRRPCRTQLHYSVDLLEIADADAADVLAEHVVTGSKAAAAIGGVVDRAVAGGDRGADDGGSGEAGADAPTPVMDRVGFRLGGGCRDRAGDGKGGESESGKLGLDRDRHV